MSDTRDLLIELGTEELPPTSLAKLSAAFAEHFSAQLIQAGLEFAQIKPYASPRRLALVVESLQVSQADRQIERRGPAVTAAFDEEGNPTKALVGFAGSCGVSVDDLETTETDKGAWLVFRQLQAGEATANLLPGMIEQALHLLPIAKRMRWGALPGEFVRPVHWLVVLFGEEVVPCQLLGVTSGRDTLGHRFHHPDKICIATPATYAPQLQTEGHVMVDMTARREAIRGQVMELARQLGGEAVINPDLLDEVTGLVEWPCALSGSFDPKFLALPAEALISSMEGHQKYFAVRAADGQLLPNFITVSNIESRDPAQVVAGNERVILPRLSDAAFFWDTDRKSPLAARAEQLKTIVFQHQLGSLYDKSQRVAKLAEQLAKWLGADAALAGRAAELAKCDLVTEMVGEFPELQGIMGRYYAQLDGENPELAEAIDEQYLPRFAGDKLPETRTGQILAIAEKLDTLVGLFGIGQPPSGVKDPFALRRAALGMLRIIIERELDIDLLKMLQYAETNLQKVLTESNSSQAVMQYCYERLRAYVIEQGFRPDEYEAVLAVQPVRPLDFMQRLRAVADFRGLPEAEALAAANKRIGNILRKNNDHSDDIAVDVTLLQDEAEKALAAKLTDVTEALTPLMVNADYAASLSLLATLRTTIDSFFDEVMVMADDPAIRRNRLALLNRLRALFLGVADISSLQA
ncbi:glycyl-tRNA ligase subunit beta [Methylophaga lonarensis MPL]|uniref:Glycine--tRNA ligase beta subunit n=1 Tax=Methylophaga lonarensis MPL TaxID=1286106 RepID=M7NV60_9GAMM|nr:glycine--tRNA ligase subunit beta [Methylophaga lonarensis]EMR12653.1 glycyl-tRNA ligase subunit beta [Methylophaga lonarensis MPL]